MNVNKRIYLLLSIVIFLIILGYLFLKDNFDLKKIISLCTVGGYVIALQACKSSAKSGQFEI